MEKILLVEDDLTLAQGIEFTLQKENFLVQVAHTLENAQKLHNAQEFDLILLDVMLPDGSGYDFCKSIRIDSQIPIIFLTESGRKAHGLNRGMKAYFFSFFSCSLPKKHIQ